MVLALKSIKSQFPIFAHWPALVYLDNAATSQIPQSVIQTVTRFYEKENASVHRGLYELSTKATQRFEAVRSKVCELIGAGDVNTIAFTKGATESINIVAQGFLKKNLTPEDNVVITAMEHHANLIPWQQVCQQTGAKLKIVPVNPQGELMLEKLDGLLDHHTKMLALTHISNVLGTVNPVEEIIAQAHQKNIPVLIDAAQSAGHFPIEVDQWGVDFLAFSAHKMFGPMGTGVLFSRKDHAQFIDPLIYGGGSIQNVEFEKTEFLDFPRNLEAGTADVPGVLGLGVAIDFIQQLDMKETIDHSRKLVTSFREKILSLDGVSLVGNPGNFSGIASFQVKNIHPHDVAGFLAHQHIAVRAGHHCAQPLLEAMGIAATVRVSFSIYNTEDDIDQTMKALVELKQYWS